MTRHGNRGKVRSRSFHRFSQGMGTRTKRGFPHSPSDGGCGYYKGQCSRTARIAGLSRFSRRTEFRGIFDNRCSMGADRAALCESRQTLTVERWSIVCTLFPRLLGRAAESQGCEAVLRQSPLHGIAMSVVQLLGTQVGHRSPSAEGAWLRGSRRRVDFVARIVTALPHVSAINGLNVCALEQRDWTVDQVSFASAPGWHPRTDGSIFLRRAVLSICWHTPSSSERGIRSRSDVMVNTVSPATRKSVCPTR